MCTGTTCHGCLVVQVPFGDWLHNRQTETRIERKGEDFVPAPQPSRLTTISLSLDRFAEWIGRVEDPSSVRFVSMVYIVKRDSPLRMYVYVRNFVSESVYKWWVHTIRITTGTIYTRFRVKFQIRNYYYILLKTITRGEIIINGKNLNICFSPSK